MLTLGTSHRTALAARALEKTAEVKTLIKGASIYLPNDKTIQGEMEALGP